MMAGKGAETGRVQDSLDLLRVLGCAEGVGTLSSSKNESVGPITDDSGTAGIHRAHVKVHSVVARAGRDQVAPPERLCQVHRTWRVTCNLCDSHDRLTARCREGANGVQPIAPRPGAVEAEGDGDAVARVDGSPPRCLRAKCEGPVGCDLSKTDRLLRAMISPRNEACAAQPRIEVYARTNAWVLQTEARCNDHSAMPDDLAHFGRTVRVGVVLAFLRIDLTSVQHVDGPISTASSAEPVAPRGVSHVPRNQRDTGYIIRRLAFQKYMKTGLFGSQRPHESGT